MSKVNQTFPDRNVCIMGLGYVGLTLATVMAECGFNVMGVEIRESVVEKVSRGEAHFFEPGLGQRLKNVVREGNLKCATVIPHDYNGTVFIITVGTPLNINGKCKLDMVQNVCREVAQHLKEDDLVIMRSTLKLGTTRDFVLPVLKETGKRFELAFCPERTLEGNALQELRQLPQIIGGVTPGAALRSAQIFQFITPTVIRVSDAETAEMIKLIDNAQRDVSFAYANEVARLCDAAGISATEVIRAGKLGYPRTNLPLPGLVGGPCLEKDPHILAEKFMELGIRPEITMSARKTNENQPQEIAAYLKKITDSLTNFPEQPVISLMGLAFKGQPATDDLRGTMARPILAALQQYYPQAVFRGFDAVVKPEEIHAFGLIPCRNMEEAMAGANLVLIMNNHTLFAQMPLQNLSELLARPGLIYDFWNHFTAEDLRLSPGTGYMALGSHARALLPERV